MPLDATNYETDCRGGQLDYGTRIGNAAPAVSPDADSRKGQCLHDAHSWDACPGAGCTIDRGEGQPAHDTPRRSDQPAIEALDRSEGATGVMTPLGVTPPAAVITTLQELQVRRIFYIKRTIMMDNAVRALTRRMLGWRMDLPERERTKINRRAAKIVDAVRNGDDVAIEDQEAAKSAAADILLCADARRPFVAARKSVEKEMCKLARSLPVWQWSAGVLGLGELALAVTVAEAGDLSGYATPSRLWKRMGLAVINGERQRMKSAIEDVAAHGYNSRRRAEIWSCISDPMFRAQSQRVDKETGEVTRPAGPYRLIYDSAKARFIAEGKATRPAHAHNHGLRLMTKAVLKDLWKAWTGE